ncbi:MAG TPA: OsmC family protein [Anaerolineales bacterium]|jgi:putative redox protein|nr:OsmC family protein [Anaerolineales bacterium]
MDARVTWSKGLSFTGEAESGFRVPLGGDPSVGGADDGLRPMELIAIGIAGCTAMDVISILQKKRQQVTAFEVVLRAGRAPDHPKIFTKLEIEYVVVGDQIEESAVQRAIQLSEERYCPAIAMFREVAPLSLSYRIQDAGE